MSFWENLLRAFGLQPPPRRYFRLEADLARSIRSMAQQQRRSEEEVASDLLNEALVQRQAAGEKLRRWRDLSPREQQVAAFICLNYTNAEIAHRLVVSPQTVKTHVRSLLWKFGLNSKQELREKLSEWDFRAFMEPKEGE
jgi:DNA-binding NarL/FixJ family response regulator